ncbi:hypothetical protein TcCL_Unassigned04741 [Trypanosoma cruzi]|nr:hypothetical protein TcCL_Unassigned04741 [Trypanosoma cruzi]
MGGRSASWTSRIVSTSPLFAFDRVHSGSEAKIRGGHSSFSPCSACLAGLEALIHRGKKLSLQKPILRHVVLPPRAHDANCPRTAAAVAASSPPAWSRHFFGLPDSLLEDNHSTPQTPRQGSTRTSIRPVYMGRTPVPTRSSRKPQSGQRRCRGVCSAAAVPLPPPSS